MQASNEAIFQVSTCPFLSKHLSRSGCAGTANFRIGGSEEFLHVMWRCYTLIQSDLTQSCFSPSSPNNFDKHASHLAVGVSQERNNKFNDMSVVFINPLIPSRLMISVLQKLIWKFYIK